MSYSAETRVLPRGRHAASREVVWESQRERLLVAMADAVAEKGYARVSVADVIGRAGVSRKTFYEQFANKEECFLAAYEAGVELLMEGIDEAVQAAAPDWIGAAQAGTTAYLEMLEANPSLARTFLVEVLAAGPQALARRAEVHERFANQLRDAHEVARRDLPTLPELPPYVFRACVGAINELVTERLTATGPEGMTELDGAVLDIQVKLLLGGVDV